MGARRVVVDDHGLDGFVVLLVAKRDKSAWGHVCRIEFDGRGKIKRRSLVVDCVAMPQKVALGYDDPVDVDRLDTFGVFREPVRWPGSGSISWLGFLMSLQSVHSRVA